MNEHYAHGTLYEIAVGLTLSHCNNFFTSYKDTTLIKIFDNLKTDVGNNTWVKIYDHAHDMSIVLRNKLIEDSLLEDIDDIAEIAWTSSARHCSSNSEHYKFTGVYDPNSDADIMIKTKSSGKFIGISAKYGKKDTSTIRAPGASYWENLLHINDLNKSFNEHNLYVQTLGFIGNYDERKEQYKKTKGSVLANLAEISSLNYRKEICRIIIKGLKYKTSEELRQIIMDLICPITIFPNYLIKTVISNQYNVKHIVYNIENETNSRLDRYDSFYVNEYNNTAMVTFRANNKITKENEAVLRFSVKNTSSPMCGWSGHVVSPMFNNKKRKNILYAFDLDYTLFHYSDDGAVACLIDENGNVCDKLTHEKLKNYSIPDNHRISFHEFLDSKIFSNTIIPISNVIDMLLTFQKRGKNVKIVTARGDFNDINLFSSTMMKHGIDINKIPVHRSGAIPNIKSIEHGKYIMFSKLIKENNYDKIYFYDDSENNLKEFMKLSTEFPNTELIPYIVKLKSDKTKAVVKKWINQ